MTEPSDQPLDRLLSQALRAGRTADVCPDAEQLAAFVEHALDAGEAALIEGHVSNCARCAAIVSAIVESEEPVVATAAPGWWSTWHVWRWVVPAVTAVAVAGVWFASQQRQPARDEKPMVMASRDIAGAPAPGPQSAETGSGTPASPAERRGIAEERPSSATAASKKPLADTLQTEPPPLRRAVEAGATKSEVSPREQTQTLPAAPVVDQRAAGAIADGAAGRDAVSGGAASAEAARSTRNEAVAAAPPVAEAPVVSAESPAVAGQLGEAVAVAPRGGAGSGRGGGARPQPQNPLLQGRVDALTRQAFAPIVLRNASGRLQWRVTGVSVERSADAGATWTPTYTAPRPLSTGAVASDDTVWLAGQAGLVVRGTASGWTIVAIPAAADLVGVSDVATRSATVQTRDGRRFRTEDGGMTWREQ